VCGSGCSVRAVVCVTKVVAIVQVVELCLSTLVAISVTLDGAGLEKVCVVDAFAQALLVVHKTAVLDGRFCGMNDVHVVGRHDTVTPLVVEVTAHLVVAFGLVRVRVTALVIRVSAVVNASGMEIFVAVDGHLFELALVNLAGYRTGAGRSWSGVGSGVRSGVGGWVRSGVAGGVRSGVGGGVRSGVGSRVWGGVRGGIWRGVGSRVWGGVRGGVRGGVGGGIRSGRFGDFHTGVRGMGSRAAARAPVSVLAVAGPTIAAILGGVADTSRALVTSMRAVSAGMQSWSFRRGRCWSASGKGGGVRCRRRGGVGGRVSGRRRGRVGSRSSGRRCCGGGRWDDIVFAPAVTRVNKHFVLHIGPRGFCYKRIY